jgi:hypothetical protein
VVGWHWGGLGSAAGRKGSSCAAAVAA